MSNHYIRTDAAGVIILGFSDAFDTPRVGDICIQEDGPRHFHQACPESLTNERGQFRFKLVNGQRVERTKTELDDELASIPKPPDPDAELAAAITAATTIADLKAALLGSGKLARVKGKLK